MKENNFYDGKEIRVQDENTALKQKSDTNSILFIFKHDEGISNAF